MGAPVRLAGFGVGALLAPEASAARPTRDVSAYGAAPYLAPEADGVRVDHRADVYSLGVIAFQLIAGRLPFDSEQALLLMVAKKSKRAPTLHEVSGLEHAPAVEAVIASALSTGFDDRHGSAGAFVEDLLRAGMGKTPHGVKRAGLPAEDDAGPPDFTDPAEIVKDLLAVTTQAALGATVGKGHRGPMLTPVALERPRLPSLAFRSTPPAAGPITEPPEPIGPRDTQPMASLVESVPPSNPPAATVSEPPLPSHPPVPLIARKRDAEPTQPRRVPGRAARAAVPLDLGAVQRMVDAQRPTERMRALGSEAIVIAHPVPSNAWRTAMLVAGTLLAILALALVIRLLVRPMLAPTALTGGASSSAVAAPPR
jgi:serine/threonine-protein kinase